MDFLLILMLLTSVLSTAPKDFDTENMKDSTSSLTVMSYNIRYNTPNDGINAWPNRKQQVGTMIGERFGADVAGLQEALKGQIEDLQGMLPGYDWVGVGRTDGHEKGEYSPIFFNSKRLELLATDTFWLSEEPYRPGSKSWDAAITRVATWARFKDKSSGKEFYFVNTHFDHRGEQARAESAKLLMKKVPQIAGEAPVVITGDFNARPDSEPYQIITGNKSFRDALHVSQKQPEGPRITFNNWKELAEEGKRIDYIFVNQKVQVLNHQISDHKFNDYFPSDHLPVVAEIKFKL